MSISALSSTSAASALSFLSRLSSNNSISSMSNNSNSLDSSQGVRPPPPDGGGFADAIAAALQSIGITDTSSSGSDTDTSATSASSDSTTSTSTTDATEVSAALGSFLQSLMGALHAQHSAGEAPPPYSEQQAGGQGGPGRLESDLQSLIAKLGANTVEGNSDSGDAVDDLQSTFANLLDKLGTSTSTSDSDSTASAGTGSTSTSDALTKLSAFLQALSAQVGNHGSSGNLVDTAV
ncbi:hypothetical protein FHW58_001527 [Duganella sp. 1224]|uniref:hypothetical protein n=1 Tax=Duganella sp. 1224 TaxID=2587052 RepID=UPI0015C82C5C|nr:hypothetical protein [Duganella sp. 1224]NYE60375.1 hypothetical protein [Duganella sp. 1224]